MISGTIVPEKISLFGKFEIKILSRHNFSVRTAVALAASQRGATGCALCTAVTTAVAGGALAGGVPSGGCTQAGGGLPGFYASPIFSIFWSLGGWGGGGCSEPTTPILVKPVRCANASTLATTSWRA